MEKKVKAVIFAGGKGTRLSEETELKPKPLVEIGGKPILWHIMKIYAAHGVKDFVVCLGHKGYAIKEYFANFFLHHSDVSFDLSTGAVDIHKSASEDWRVTLVDTGEESLTAKRLGLVAHHLQDCDDFCLTYGDGVGDVDISAALEFHRKENRLATVTVVQPAGRFGSTALNGNTVERFDEKPAGDGGWINAGFFVVNKNALDVLNLDGSADEMWEHRPLSTLAEMGQLGAWRHHGFWHPMDTLRDKQMLEERWKQNQAPWRIWR